MKPTPSCPSVELLLQLDRGELTEMVAGSVAQHLANCVNCQARLSEAHAKAPADPLLRDLRILQTPVNPSFKTINRQSDPTAIQPNNFAAVDATFLSLQPEGEVVPPRKLLYGPFEIKEKIGQGGMGDVYLAKDLRLDREVVLKRLKKNLTFSKEALTRFLAETKALAQLQHPNVVQIYELYADVERPYAVIEYLRGGSLADRMKQSLPPPRAAAQLMIGVAKAIHAAHELQILHRDLKPANILLTGDQNTPWDQCVPKVSDYGLVKFLGSAESPHREPAEPPATDSNKTHAGAILGTPTFMAPEQASGDTANAGPAVDIYALGATLYDLLCGRPPFRGATVQETLEMVQNATPTQPRKINANIPRDLETICLKCLEKQPERRYPTAKALADDLQRFLNGDPITARATGPLERSYLWTRKRPALASALGTLVLLCIALLGSAFWFTYTLAKADKDRAKADHERELAEARFAQQQAEQRLLEQRQADTTYRDHVALIKERLVVRACGWTRQAIDDVRTAMTMPTSQRSEAELRSVLAEALVAPDLCTREPRVLAEGVNTWALAFHPHKRWLAIGEGRVGNWPSSLRIFIVDLDKGSTIQTLEYPFGAITDLKQDRVRALAYSPDGRWLVAGTRKGQLHRWDMNQEKPARQTIRLDERAAFQDLVFAPDGRALFGNVKIELSGNVMRWDTETWQMTSQHPTTNCYGGMALAPDGVSLYCNTSESSLLELDTDDLTRERETFAPGEAFAQAISSDGRTLATANGGRLVLWDLASRQKAGILRETHREQAFPTEVNIVRFSPDGRYLAAANEFTRHVYVYDVVSGVRIADWRSQGEGIHPIAFDPTGRWLAVGGLKGTTLLELNHRPDIHRVVPNPFPLLAAGLDKQGQHLVVCGSRSMNSNGEVEAMLWPLAPKKLAPCLWKQMIGVDSEAQVQAPPNTMAFMVNERIKLVGMGEPSRSLYSREMKHAEAFAVDPQQRIWVVGDGLRVIDLQQLDAIAPRYSNPTAPATGRGALISIHLSQSYAAVGGLDGTLRLFSTTIPAKTRELVPLKVTDVDRRNDLRSVAIAPDESYAVVGTESGRAYVVSLPDLKVLASWPAHTDRLGDIVFLGPNTFVTGSNDHALRFWQWKQPRVQELWTQRLTGDITSISSACDGRWLAVTALGERGVHLWDLHKLNDAFAQHHLGWDVPKNMP